MNLYLFDVEEIVKFSLPTNKMGNFWISDNEGKNVINVSAKDNEWIVSGSDNSKIICNNNYVDNSILMNKTYYYVEKNSAKSIFFVDDIQDNTFKTYKAKDNIEVKIGRGNDCDISLSTGCLLDLHATLFYNNNVWTLVNNSVVYLNNKALSSSQTRLMNGDIINIYGLKIVIFFGMLFINNPFNNLVVNSQLLYLVQFDNSGEIIEEQIEDEPIYKDEHYFFKSPRLKRVIETLEMNIDSPPQKEEEKNMPLIYTLGPMMTMGASSIISLSNVFTEITNGTKTVKDSLTTIVVSSSMICSMLVWPFLTKGYEKRQRRKKEKKRQNRYKTYLMSKKRELQNEYNTQIKILEENLLSTDVCYDNIVNKKRVLWERKIEQGDFLTVRVGVSQIPLDAKINYHKEDFSMDDDNLIKMLEDIAEEFKILNNVPVGYSFAENKITNINGLYPKKLYFIYNMLLQLMSYHSYDNLKLVVFTNSKKKNNWNFLKNSVYTFSDDKSIRFFATNTEEMQDVSLYLEKIFQYRKEALKDNRGEKAYLNFDTYYLVLIDDMDLARKIDIVDDILETKGNYGFSIIIDEDKLSKLPSQCTNFISIGDKSSGILKNDLTSNTQIKFNDEVIMNYDMNYVSYLLSNLPIYVENKEKTIPNVVTFLEMFGVGNVEQLNSLKRWKENDPTKSLKTRVGVNENIDPFMLDLHEKQHGPHGLVAGMTGSGKSEFIITYILSMAVNYSPEEVAFVLIDYKGGGLAGAFENKELGVKLPHVIGTITNLDKSEINRALSSIDSELRRRQQKFNEVRDAVGESTIDIYKYQKLYRDGTVKEPMPHLIIVSDEFAELKSQQPDFMNDLISTARIGRSLGVHLILATQKPTGVVDAQIWSNSKFKICLKVQDKSDSMEMIKCGDAAELKNVGRFYLQVGYNEFFALGQSAWAGANYYPSNEFKKSVDKNIYFIDNIGSVYNAIDNSDNKKNSTSKGEELANVLNYIIEISDTLNYRPKQLWMEKISPIIYVSNLIKKYQYSKEPFIINPIIGEYDDPSNQVQELLTLPITRNGNTLLYGLVDSGRDDFLQTLVYSIITTYTTEEVNLYLLDFGAETLINFNDAPQVGDVILNSDADKLVNFIKLLNSIINNRKKQFLSYNGNYLDYIKLSGKTLPNIVIVINVVEILSENFMDRFDDLLPIIRDGSKYGINFVITTTNPTSVRFKVVQSCKQVLSLQLNNENDYRDIFGKTEGVIPSKILGRGLVKKERVCEFQTATIVDAEEKLGHIKETISNLITSGMKKALPVPMMPETIRIDSFINEYKGLNSVPIGIYKEELEPCVYDFTKSVINLVSANEMSSTNDFVDNLLKTLQLKNDFNKFVVDPSNYFEEYNYDIKYYDTHFEELIDKLKEHSDSMNKVFLEQGSKALKNTPNTVCVIVGLEKFINKLSEETMNKFKEILSQNKEMLKINFIFVDIPSGFKKYEFETWYRDNVDNDDGIWIGFGVTQQMIIRLVLQPTKFSNINNEYAIVAKNGMPKVIKLINE